MILSVVTPVMKLIPHNNLPIVWMSGSRESSNATDQNMGPFWRGLFFFCTSVALLNCTNYRVDHRYSVSLLWSTSSQPFITAILPLRGNRVHLWLPQGLSNVFDNCLHFLLSSQNALSVTTLTVSYCYRGVWPSNTRCGEIIDKVVNWIVPEGAVPERVVACRAGQQVFLKQRRLGGV